MIYCTILFQLWYKYNMKMTTEVLDPEVSLFLQKEGQDTQRLTPPTVESFPPEILQVTDKIAEVSGTWNPVEIYTPNKESIGIEKSAFFRAFLGGKRYLPTFNYSYAGQLNAGMVASHSRDQLMALGRQVYDFKPSSREERFLRIAVYNKIRDDLATCDLAEGIHAGNEPMIAQAMKRKYGSVNEGLLGNAIDIYNDNFNPSTNSETTSEPILSSEEQEFLKNQSFDAGAIKSLFEWSLSRFGILKTDTITDGFQVVISREVTSIDVRDKSSLGPTIFIPEDRVVSGDKALELVEHEIRGHARQSMNGYKLFKIGGGVLKFDDETLYEGLAKRYDEAFNERFMGKNTGRPIPYYTFAVAKAEAGGSFYDVFTEQLDLRLRAALKIPLEQSLPSRDQLDEKALKSAMESAWMTTYRVMRGHTDMSNSHSYAMSKDLSYLQGWLMDRQLQERGFGYINEAAVIAQGGLLALAEFPFKEDDLPVKDREIALEYWQEVLKPQMQSTQSSVV